jgi:hypothetical protein
MKDFSEFLKESSKKSVPNFTSEEISHILSALRAKNPRCKIVEDDDDYIIYGYWDVSDGRGFLKFFDRKDAQEYIKRCRKNAIELGAYGEDNEAIVSRNAVSAISLEEFNEGVFFTGNRKSLEIFFQKTFGDSIEKTLQNYRGKIVGEDIGIS